MEGWPRHNTFQVFGDFNENVHTNGTSYSSHFVRHNVPPNEQRILSAGRKNKPQPTSATFLRQNPRFTCEPICHVSTAMKETQELHPWWPKELPEKIAKKPKYSLESTSRLDYQKINSQKVFGRYTANLNITESATGIVPGSKTNKNLRFAEKISYEHQYNSRLDPNEPVRGKRHGSFVWKPAVFIPHKNVDKIWRPKPQQEESTTQNSLGINMLETSNHVELETARSSKPKSAPVQKDSTNLSEKKKEKPTESQLHPSLVTRDSWVTADREGAVNRDQVEPQGNLVWQDSDGAVETSQVINHTRTVSPSPHAV